MARGRECLPTISRRVAPQVPMEALACFSYLQGIELDLNPDKIQGLALFYEYLIRRGEASPQALPLKIYQTTIG